jgi:UV DNA damage endonuclease
MKSRLNPKTRLGYACISLGIGNNITTNRTMRERTFLESLNDSESLKYVGEIALQNVKDLVRIIGYNKNMDINVFRISSDMFPFWDRYKLEDLPQFNSIKNILGGCGEIIRKHDMRVGFHPGPFNQLASPNPKVEASTIIDLEQHSKVLDLLGMPCTPYYSINIHVGGHYGDKMSTLARFKDRLSKLSPALRSRLVIENDDRDTCYSVKDLVDLGQPITFDFFHHTFHPDGLSTQEGLELAMSTWGDTKPLTHFSSSKKVWEDALTKNPRTHADWVWEEILDFGHPIDIEIEAKAKDLALIKYRKEFLS